MTLSANKNPFLRLLCFATEVITRANKVKNITAKYRFICA